MKKIILIPIALISLLAAIYIGGWKYMEAKMESGITQHYNATAPNLGFSFQKTRPTISGFPGVPVITYEKGFMLKDANIRLTKITIKGYPIPLFPITISSEKQILYWNDTTGTKIAFDEFIFKFKMPLFLPKTFTKHHIKEWQEAVGQIEILDFFIRNKDTEMTAVGHIGLDKNLQITADLSTRTFGHTAFIKLLAKESILTSEDAALTLSLFDSMTEKSKVSGAEFVRVHIKTEDNKIFANSFKIKDTQTIEWF